jgi:hypothetical protein
MKTRIFIFVFLSALLGGGFFSIGHAQTRAVTKIPAQGKKTEAQIEKEIVERNLRLIQDTTDALDNLRYEQRSCFECYAGSAGEMALTMSDASSASEKKKCVATWSDFYSKPEIDIRYVFGYGDDSDDSVVDDTLSRQMFVDRVMSACDSNVRVCGFARSADDADLFEKTVVGPTGEKHKIKLRLTASSNSTSDRINQAFSQEQKEKSENAKKVFYAGIGEADMLMYVGHARDGGGPDFSPAIRRKADGKIDYDHYSKNKPGLEDLTKALTMSRNTPKILGFLACNSERWLGRLVRMAPKSGLLLSSTDNIAAEAALAQAYAALDSVLWQRCEKSFNGSMNQFESYAGRKLEPVSLRRFFDRKPSP